MEDDKCVVLANLHGAPQQAGVEAFFSGKINFLQKTYMFLKGLSHEMDFNNVDEN